MALCLFAGYMRGSADGYQRGYEEAGKPQIKYVKTYLEHTYIGNYNSELFHSCYCSTLPYPDKRIYFDDREVAVSLGYKPCQNCNP